MPNIECQFIVKDGDAWINPETGDRFDTPPIGGIWFAPWYTNFHCQLEHPLVVRTPGGDWLIDSRANNCDKPDDDEHFCWILHGRPPFVTVDKNGNTCGAGAGSIKQGDRYHGFLKNGILIET